jgi:hypothetical protein
VWAPATTGAVAPLLRPPLNRWDMPSVFTVHPGVVHLA